MNYKRYFELLKRLAQKLNWEYTEHSYTGSRGENRAVASMGRTEALASIEFLSFCLFVFLRMY